MSRSNRQSLDCYPRIGDCGLTSGLIPNGAHGNHWTELQKYFRSLCPPFLLNTNLSTMNMLRSFPARNKWADSQAYLLLWQSSSAALAFSGWLRLLLNSEKRK